MRMSRNNNYYIESLNNVSLDESICVKAILAFACNSCQYVKG